MSLTETSPPSSSSYSRLRVCMIGSGNFASAIVRNVGDNVRKHADRFEPEVRMWVHEEDVQVDGGEVKKISAVINERHENVKYLPGVTLPDNVVAEPDMERAADGADVVIFCLPHQFIEKACKGIKSHVHPSCVAVSLVKGFHGDPTRGHFQLITELVTQHLGVPCSCLMGANLADEIAKGLFCESTVACGEKQEGKESGEVLRMLFENENFRVNVIPDVKSAEMCGALKNIVGVASGMVDGMNMGNNCKAAIIRLGLVEMVHFIKHLHPECQVGTFLQSCGVADLVTTCYGGRNRLVGEHFVTSEPRKSLAQLEKELLNGQKLQGPLTAREVCQKLEAERLLDRFPLFTAVDLICRGEMRPEELLEVIKKQPRDYGELPEGI